MARADYCIELCRELERVAGEAPLEIPYRKPRYDSGDVLELDFTTVWPETAGHARFRVDKFVGGGFAGQVYRCTLDHVWLEADAPTDLREGGTYAIKIMLPPSRFSRKFRDLVYWLAFQAPFSAQVNRAACRAGLLWQKFSLLAAGITFERDDAVADVYASFHDANLAAYGEIREWVEGRTWHLEADTDFRRRRQWRSADPASTGSPEYTAKRQFMHRFVRMLHDMGAPELARQYEWWTMKSQPNTLKRSGADGNAAAGLCAVDFRAGLALLPFLPMSPVDVPLILAGMRRGSLVQFDRPDLRKLQAFAERHAARCAELPAMAAAIKTYDRQARAAMPDITHQGLQLIRDAGLRHSVRQGLIEGYQGKDLVDADYARRLGSRAGAFAGFYLLGAVPLLGRLVRKLRGHTAFRRHTRRLLTSGAYFRAAMHAALASRLLTWHRKGRSGKEHTAFLLQRPALFWLERLTVGWFPPGMHRALADPRYAWGRVKAGIRFMRDFYKDAAFRERWLTGVVEAGYKDGMLRPDEHEEILSCVSDPFIAKYLKCLAVHFMTLPVTQIVSVIVGGILAGLAVARGASGAEAGILFGKVIVIFQIIPISPGSICRGLYVVYLMVKERNGRDYVVAAPLSFAKYIGYLAFPIQMAATYPALARFMASRWATDAVHIVPVFGEKGALFEHMIFDLFFNLPRRIGEWAKPRIRGLLDVWLVLGLVLIGVGCYGPATRFAAGHVDTASIEAVLAEVKTIVTVLIAGVAIFILPRILFYPMLTRRKHRQQSEEND